VNIFGCSQKFIQILSTRSKVVQEDSMKVLFLINDVNHMSVATCRCSPWSKHSMGTTEFGRPRKGRILQHRRKSSCIGVSCTSLKIQLLGMDSDLSKS
jgi:hypothetical protein